MSRLWPVIALLAAAIILAIVLFGGDPSSDGSLPDGEDFIDEHHLYHVRDGDGPTELETLTMRRVYRWDHAHLTPLLEDVGFVDVRTDHVQNVKGHRFAMNRAFRPK